MKLATSRKSKNLDQLLVRMSPINDFAFLFSMPKSTKRILPSF